MADRLDKATTRPWLVKVAGWLLRPGQGPALPNHPTIRPIYTGSTVDTAQGYRYTETTEAMPKQIERGNR